MKSKYKPLVLLTVILLTLILIVMVTGCSHKSLKGATVNHYADEGRSNSYENYVEFLNYKYYDEVIKDSNNAGAAVAPVPLSNQEFIFAATDGTISMVIDSKILWTKKLDEGNIIAAAMCVDKEQNAYAVSNTGIIYSFDYDGKLRWKNKIADTIGSTDIPCDLLAQDNGIIAGTTNGILKKINFEGKEVWSKNFKNTINKTISGFGENILLSLSSENDNDTLLAVNPDGSEKWRKAMNIRLIKFPVSNGKNIVCCGLRYENAESISKIFYLDLSGNIIWNKEINWVARYASIAQSGEVFINAFQSGLGEQISNVFRFSQDGTQKWQKNFNFTIPTPIMISHYSIAFLGVSSKSVGLYIVGREDGIIKGIHSFSNELPILHSPTVRPDGSISFAYYQNLGFLKVDEPWINKLLPW